MLARQTRNFKSRDSNAKNDEKQIKRIINKFDEKC